MKYRQQLPDVGIRFEIFDPKHNLVRIGAVLNYHRLCVNNRDCDRMAARPDNRFIRKSRN